MYLQLRALNFILGTHYMIRPYSTRVLYKPAEVQSSTEVCRGIALVTSETAEAEAAPGFSECC